MHSRRSCASSCDTDSEPDRTRTADERAEWALCDRAHGPMRIWVPGSTRRCDRRSRTSTANRGRGWADAIDFDARACRAHLGRRRDAVTSIQITLYSCRETHAWPRPWRSTAGETRTHRLQPQRCTATHPSTFRQLGSSQRSVAQQLKSRQPGRDSASTSAAGIGSI